MIQIILFDGKKHLIFYIYLLFFTFINNSSENYDIAEYRELYVKKCLDLYNGEAKQFESLPKSMEYAYLNFYENRLGLAADAISNYIHSKTSSKFEISIYGPNPKRDYFSEPIQFKAFRLEPAGKKFWSISTLGINTSLGFKDSPRINPKMVFQNQLNMFLKHFFQMYRSIQKIILMRDNPEFAYISIDDTNNNVRKRVPKKYTDIKFFLLNNIYKVFCVQIFSDIEILDTNINKSRMKEVFTQKFGEMTYFFYGCYDIYVINISNDELHEYNYIKKIFKRFSIYRFRIKFDIGLPPQKHGNLILYPACPSFETAIHSTEFDYFYSTINVQHEDYKFKIFLKYSDKLFEFNFNWPEKHKLFENYVKNSSVYLYALSSSYESYGIEMMRDDDLKCFKDKRAAFSSDDFYLDCCGKIEYKYDRYYEYDEFFDMMIFHNKHNIYWNIILFD
ncbi:hypothetical protein CWI38_0040p0110 [Hamiltosporidium tvaerminnensis]|uniref:Uncharacterized protein n=1 Tax=Hamiltosporidium tvaerminnensis TaxID=1176355 RepID=A0A4Q9M4H6_9MICR|nr:hypothetical protein CWI38_0040p0110 [Hamiltosporidium tvaerminnensis]